MEFLNSIVEVVKFLVELDEDGNKGEYKWDL